MPCNDFAYEEFQSDFQTLYEDAPVAYQSLGPRGEILLVNNAWLQLLGYTRDEVLGRPFADFLTPASQAVLDERLRNLRAEGCTTNQDFEMVSCEGEVVPVRVDGRVVRGERGEFRRTHCIVRDTRAEMAARRAWERSEGRYRRLVELAREGIWEIDRDAVTVYVNPAMARMLGYTADEMIGCDLASFMDERGRRISERNLARRRRGIEELHDFEFVTKTGQRIITTMATSPLYDEDGDYSGALAGVIDVTERRRFEQEMLHTQKLESLGVLAGGIAHDFNNLLQAVIGNAELALQDVGENALACESLFEIQRAAGRATDLCRQMLAYAGKGRVRREDVDVAALVVEMAEILKVSLSKKAAFTVEVAADLPVISGDSSQIGQIVMNLITNASEALGDDEGSVKVVAKAENLTAASADQGFPLGQLTPGLHVVLTVTDTGCGMREGSRQRIFDPFFTTKFAGRGLGLAAVLGIVKSHGGGIEVQSTPQQGTTVTVALPAHAAEIRELPGAESPGAEVGSRALNILVAEDEPGVQRVLLRLLDRLGHTVQLAVNGQEALDYHAIHGETIDLIMLDLTMPVMGGKEAMKEIRGVDHEVPIIICSGFPAEDIAREFGSEQPQFYLQKPFDVAELQSALATYAR